MISVLLVLHVVLALTSLFMAFLVVGSSNKKHIESAANYVNKMFLSTSVTVLSGILLVLLTHSSIGSVCISLLTFNAVIISSYLYFRKTKLAER